jgi:SAM-dependent methyltransferase
VVEIGSRYRPGFRELADLRPHFPGLEYIGCDLEPGPGVDRIEDAERLRFADGAAGAVLLLEVLEHLRRPERALAEARRVLRGDGLLVVSVPTSYRLHGFPADYWRFTASGLARLLADFPDAILFALGPRLKPALAFAVASRSASPAFTAAKQRFRGEVEEAFRRTRLRGYASVLKERGRDFFGALFGRADLSVAFFPPASEGPEADGKMNASRAASGSSRDREPCP